MNSPLEVLIVDDSPAIRTLLQRVLLQSDLTLVTIHEACDGRQALEKMNTGHIGLVLSDINMPKMDGLELLSSVKANSALQSIPVFMITGDNSRNKVQRALQLGAAGYFRKPFNVEHIRGKLTSIVQSL